MPNGKVKRRNVNLEDYFQDGINGLVFWSFRYFLGRQTIATVCFAQELAKAFPLLDEHHRQLIKRELTEMFEQDDRAREEHKLGMRPRRIPWFPLGADCDRAAWKLVLDSANKE